MPTPNGARGRILTSLAVSVVMSLTLAACGGGSPQEQVPQQTVTNQPSAAASPGEAPSASGSVPAAGPVYAELPAIASAADTERLLPTTKDAAAAMSPLTPRADRFSGLPGPLTWSDTALIEPAECTPFASVGLAPMPSPDGGIRLAGARTWRSKEKGEYDVPRLTLSALLYAYDDPEGAEAAFEGLASTAESCTVHTSTINPDSAQVKGVIDSDTLEVLKPFTVRYPLVSVDRSSGIIQRVSEGDDGITHGATAIVLAGDRLLVTEAYRPDDSIAEDYPGFLAFTAEAVARATGTDPASVALVPFDELPVQDVPAGGGEEDGVSRAGVVYVVTGSSSRVSLTYATASGTEQQTASTPWEQSLGEMAAGSFLYVAAQDDTGSGSVTCTIYVDGQEISRNTSSGAYSIATCEGTR